MPRRASRAGRLRDRVAVQYPTETQPAGDEAQVAQAWDTTATVWAEVVATGGQEFERDGRVEATVTHKVTVRRTATTLAVTPKHRLLVTSQGGKVLNVLAVMPVDNGREFLAILCTEPA